MKTNEVPRGPVSDHVVQNVKRLRATRGLSLAGLSERLAQVGRPILSTGLHRLEAGKRRVDCDDLVALALAFDVSPLTLLLPFSAAGVTDLTSTVQADALTAWDWARGLRPAGPLPDDEDEARYVESRFRLFSTPMGARLDELRPGSPEYEERQQRQAEHWSRKHAGEDASDGEH